MKTKAATKSANRGPHTKSTRNVHADATKSKLPPHDGPPHEGDPKTIKVTPSVKPGKKTAAPPAKKLSVEERLDRLEATNRALKAKLRTHGIHIEGLDGETV